MNHLNSTLLEGDLADAPREAKTANGKTTCTFQIDSKREHEDDATREEVSRITVQTTGRLAEACIATLGKAGGVRVVGHIKQDKEAGLIVVAEHVEFKPKADASADGGGVFMNCEILSKEQANGLGCAFEFWNRDHRAMCACGKTPVATVSGHAFCVECLPDVLIRVGGGSYIGEPNEKGAGRCLATKEDFLAEAKRVAESRVPVTA